MADTLALSRLLQLASPMLPVGAYTYSQGLEWAIESGEVHDFHTALNWVRAVLIHYQARFELPVLQRLYHAWQQQDLAAVETWNAFYAAGRDTAEAWAETHQMGYSLVRLVQSLDDLSPTLSAQLSQLAAPTFPAVYAALAQHWKIPLPDALQAYAWGWLENQASATMKAVPLGQVAGQKMLLALGAVLPEIVAQAMVLPEEEISNFNPLLSLAGCLHETQYSRLFRS